MNLELRIKNLWVLFIIILLVFPRVALAQVNYSSYINNEYTPLNPSLVPADLKQDLETEVNKMLIDQNGDGKFDHLAPFIVPYGGANNVFYPENQYDTTRGGKSQVLPAAFWVSPTDQMYSLARAYPYLSTATQTKVKSFITSEIGSYNPLTFEAFGSGFNTGINRSRFNVPSDSGFNIWPPVSPKIEAAYAFWLYYKVTNDQTILNNNWNSILNLYNKYKTALNGGRQPIYSEIGGLIGVARIAKVLNQTATQTDAEGLANQIMANQGLNFNQMQTGVDNAVATGQYGTHWTVFLGIQPEVGKYLKDTSSSAITTYLADRTSMRKIPVWWEAFAETQGYPSTLGYANASKVNGLAGEVPYNTPDTSYSLFLGHAYGLGLNQQQLRMYLSAPWALGDLYYINRLVTTIEAPSTGAPPPTQLPTTKLGDITGPTGVPDNKVNIFDFNQLLADFGCNSGVCLRSDVEKSGGSLDKVDIFDFNTLLANFGK